MKSEWIKPQLVVVHRGNVDESVLLTCKNSGDVATLGPESLGYGCWVQIGTDNVCRIDNIS